jgi:P4 family phage/plasmid primase-like protien
MWSAALVETLICRKLYRNYFARDATTALFSYYGGAYRPRGELLIRHAAKAVIPPDKWSNGLASETVERIRADAPFLWERPPVTVLNLSNGLLDVKTRELRPHNPSHLSPLQLAVAYNPDATCEAWDKQARETFPGDAYEAGVHWQIVAWLMVPYTGLQKALLLLGEGGTGKSTFLRALSAFLGRRNISAESLQQLEQGRFSSASLIGRLANICADLPSTHLDSSAMFKRVTGEDPISTERKFRDCIETTVYARLIFSANVPPMAVDATDAFYARWYVLPFDHRYRGTDEEVRSDELDARLSQPRELSGVLIQALKFLPSVLKDGVTVTESMRDAHLEFRRMTDPLAVWLIQHTVYDPANDQLMVPCSVLIEEFNRDCARDGRPGMSNTAFGLALAKLKPAAVRAQRVYHGRPHTSVYLHLALRAREGQLVAD